MNDRGKVIRVRGKRGFGGYQRKETKPMSDHLAERERLLRNGGPALADYALELERQIGELKRELELARTYEPCPYPLYQRKYGPTHDRKIGRIPNEDDPTALGHSIVMCEACRNVTIQQEIALA